MCRSFEICEREGLLQALRELSGNDDAQLPDNVRAGGTAFPGTFAPVFVSASSKEDAPSGVGSADELFPLEVRELGFGWPLEWKKESAFNARLDSLLQGKAPWGDALSRRRCILPCAAFYESHHSEKVASSRTGKPVKRRYTFASPDGAPLLLAAVYSAKYFSVVTTEPNVAVAAVHDRMPLVLTVEEARRWLDADASLEWIVKLADRCAIQLSSQGEGETLPVITQPELPL